MSARRTALALTLLVSIAACAANHVEPRAARYRAPSSNSPREVAASIVMSDIPAGHYLMGSMETGFQSGYPQHAVAIPALRLSRCDVTFDQYDAYARATHRPLPPDEGWGRADRPVINVEWQDIQDFIAWLNRGTGRRFRLPSEAEWEYAARAGTTTHYWWGDDPNPDLANTAANQGRDVWPFTSPVASFPENAYGLFDMLGNVWQFVQDCRHLNYVGAPADGSAWMAGECDSHIVRGGFYGSLRIGMRSNTRGAAGDHFHSMGLGFRLAESVRK